MDEAASLPKLQGLLNRAKDSFYKFEESTINLIKSVLIEIRDHHTSLEMMTFGFGKNEEEIKEDTNASTMKRRDVNNLLEQN